jgi:hypothetical protein
MYLYIYRYMFTPSELFGPFHSGRPHLKTARHRLTGLPINELQTLLEPGLPSYRLASSEEGPFSRERVYSLLVTVWTFLWQVLNPGSACREAVQKVGAWFKLRGLPPVSPDTSPYCQARRKLPLETLQQLLTASAHHTEQGARLAWRFHGRPVKVGDGTFCQAPDTPANQRSFPQSRRQKPGCGFPLVRIVALFSLATGALLSLAIGNKHKAELQLFRKIWDELKAGDIYLADRYFCDYVTLAWLQKQGVDVVVRLHASRRHDLRQGKALGKYDRLVTWLKPKHQAKSATKKIWRALPSTVTLRLIRFPVQVPGFRPKTITLVTTLLDPRLYPAAELAGLYLRRWRVELFWRKIKTTLQMDMLSCKTPPMVRREIHCHLIAYNLIRRLMVEAANIYDVDIARLSFKGTLDALRQYSLVIVQAKSRRQKLMLMKELPHVIAKDLLPDRPNRVEPRVQKKRPKAYPCMVQPRRVLKAKILKNRKYKGA